MAIAIRSEASGASTASGAGAIAIAKPSSIVNDDYVVILIAKGDDPAFTATPSGFTAYALGATVTAPDILAGIYYKKITDAGSEPATYGFTTANNLNYAYWIGSLSGIDLTTPEDVTFTGRWTEASSSAIAASVTTVTGGAFVLGCISMGDDAAVTNPPAPWSSRANNLAIGGVSSFNVFSRTKPVAGATDDATLGGASGTADRVSAQFPFRPAIASGSGEIAYKSAGAGTFTETSGANLSPVCPAVVAANDILIAHIVVLDATSALSTPSGWELLFGPSALGTGTPTGRAWAYGRIADGSEDGAAINFGSLASTVGRLGRIYSFSGYVSGTIDDVVPAASFSENASETDPVIQAVTTTVDGAIAVTLVSQDDDNPHNGLGVVTGGNWVEAVADYTDANVGAQGAKLQLQVGFTPSQAPGTINGGTVAGTDDEANTMCFEIRPSASEVALETQDIALALSIDTTTITQNHVIQPQDIALGLSTDNSTTTQNHVIPVDDIALALSEDNTTIEVSYVVVVQDIALSLTEDNTTLAQAHTIASQDIALGLTEDNATIAQNHVLPVNDITLSLSEDNTAVAETNFSLTVQDVLLSLTEDNTTLNQNHVVATQDIALSLTEDNTTITQNHAVTAQDIALALTEDNTTLTQNHVVPVADIALALSADNTTVAEEGDTVLVTQDIALSLTEDNTTLTQNHVIGPQDILLSLTEDNTIIIQNHIVAIQDIGLSLSIDNATITQNQTLVVQDILHSLTMDNATLSVSVGSVITYRILRGPRTTRGPRQYSFTLARRGPRHTRPPRSC